jgi:hypothetical protein
MSPGDAADYFAKFLSADLLVLRVSTAFQAERILKSSNQWLLPEFNTFTEEQTRSILARFAPATHLLHYTFILRPRVSTP